MNNQDYWFPWYPGVFHQNTMHLTLEQDAIYRRLIDHYMITREPLPESYVALSRIVGCPIEIIEENATAILNAYFTHTNGMYSHAKCDEILDDQDKRTKKRSDAGKRAAKKRWSQVSDNKEENANAITDPMRIDATGQDRDRTVYKDSTNVESRPCDVLEAFTAFVDLAKDVGLSVPQSLNATRKTKIKQRLKESGGLGGWHAALERLRESSFCKGDNNSGWKADLDFVLQQKSFTKLMEGSYDDRQGTKQSDKNRDALQEWVEQR